MDHPSSIEGEAAEFSDLYDRMRALARRWLAELPPGQTLQPTALVHEAWMRVAGRDSPLPPSRRTLVFVMSRAMRDTLVEDARRKGALKRGARSARVALPEDFEDEREPEGGALEVLAVHESLTALELEDPASAQVVLLRYFAGLTVPEVAEALDCSVSSVERRWGYARAWLRRRMDAGGGPGA